MKPEINSLEETYEEVAKLSRFKVNDLWDRCLILVTDKNNKDYGKIGILKSCTDNKEFFDYLVQFGNNNKRKVLKCRWMKNLTDGLYMSINPEMILKEKKQLEYLFRMDD
jgi:hypothetical protein